MLTRLITAAVSCLVLVGLLTPAASAADEPVVQLEVTAFRSPAGVSVHWRVISSSHGWTGAVVRRDTGSGTTLFAVQNRESVADPAAPADASYTVALVTTAGEAAPSPAVVPDASTDGVYFGTTPADGSGYGLYSAPLVGAPHGVRTNLPAAGLEAGAVYASPTGDRLVTIHSSGDNRLLYVRDADGSGAPRLLASFQRLVQPTWSPDGTRLAVLLFHGAPSRPVELAIVPLDGSGPTVIEDSMLESGWGLSDVVHHPAWWPDGRSLVVGDVTGQLIRVAAEPGARTLETLSIRGWYPTISPDGDWIGYFDGVSTAVSRFDGSAKVGIGSPSGDGLIWSPDGRTVVGYHAPMGSAIAVTRSRDGSWAPPVAVGARSDAMVAEGKPFVTSWYGAAVGIGPVPAGTTIVPIDTDNLPAGTTIACTIDSVSSPCGRSWNLTGTTEGARRLRVVATEPSGRTTVATRDVVVPAPAFRSTVSLVTAGQLPASWRPGCPVGPQDLRRVTLTHHDFDGRTATGELVVHADVAGQVVDAFADLYRLGFRIERMRPVDGYGGDNDASMAANNTSAFNCQPVPGATSWSNHAYGRAIDINPVQNPYVLGGTVLPPAGAAYLDRSPGRGKLRPGEGTVEAFTSRGWTWGGTWTSPRDYQHVERRTAPSSTQPAQGGASVASATTGEVHLAQRTGTGTVVVRTRSGGTWLAPTDLGGRLISTPDLAVRGNALDVVALGADGAVWHRHGDGTTWSPWRSLGGRLASGPSVVASGPGRLDVFARGIDDALWTTTWTTAGGWGRWSSLGGRVTSDPDAASWADGRIDVVVRGMDGAIWQRVLSRGAWSGWFGLGGSSASGPAIASRAPGRLDVLTTRTDGRLSVRAWDGTRWSGWNDLGGLLGSDPDAAVEPGGPLGTLHVVAAGGDGTSLYGRAHRTSWTAWTRWPLS